MKNNDNENKKKIISIFLIIVCICLVIISASFAFFTPKIDNDVRTVIDIEASDVATITYYAGNELNLEANEPNTTSNEMTFSVKLEGSHKHDTYSYYDINWIVNQNTFEYGENNTPELKYDLYKSTDGSNWTKVIDNRDCTTISGTNKIITRNEIFAAKDATTIQYWKVVLRFVDTNENQNHNQNKVLKSVFEVSNME